MGTIPAQPEDKHFVHADDPKASKHVPKRDCWCGPTLRQEGERVIVIHYCESQP